MRRIFTLGLIGLASFTSPAMAACQRCAPETVQEAYDRKQREEASERNWMILGGTAFFVIAGVMGYQFVRDTKLALAASANRDRRPWDA